MIRHSLALLVLSSCVLSLVGCGDAPAKGASKLRFSGIPDADKAAVEKKFAVVSEYLSKELGVEVEWISVNDYSGAVTALSSNKVDLVWLGGVTSVQAENRNQGDVTFVACRESDLQFKSYFIANKALIDSGEVKAVDNLADLKDFSKDRSFTFGSKNSTSGHVMPRTFMKEAGVDPEQDFKAPAGYQLQGGHSATLQAVATGATDMGALNYKTWEKASDDVKQNAPVIFETPPYVDYCMVAHNRLGDELISKIREAFLQLDTQNSDHQGVLEAFSAEKFVAAKPADWDGIRAVVKELDLK